MDPHDILDLWREVLKHRMASTLGNKGLGPLTDAPSIKASRGNFDVSNIPKGLLLTEEQVQTFLQVVSDR